MSDGGVCRTAPATPGLLKTMRYKVNEMFSNLFKIGEVRILLGCQEIS